MTNKSNKTNAAISGYTFEGARAVVLADIKRAIVDEGQDLKVFALDFTAGLIAKRLYSDLPRPQAIAKGKGIMGATSQGHEPKPGQAVRTAEQEAAWEAARKQWRRCGLEAGVLVAKPGKPRNTKTDKRGGKPKGGKPATKAPAKPKSAGEANLALMNMAQSASAYCAKHKSIVCEEASHAAANFLAAMAKLAK